MRAEVRLLISSATGYDAPETDDELLEYLSASVEKEILADINDTDMPDELLPLWDRRTAAAYLHIRRADILGSDNLNMAKRITEGKVTVEISGATPEERLDALIAVWKDDRGLLSCFRKIRW